MPQRYHEQGNYLIPKATFDPVEAQRDIAIPMGHAMNDPYGHTKVKKDAGYNLVNNNVIQGVH